LRKWDTDRNSRREKQSSERKEEEKAKGQEKRKAKEEEKKTDFLSILLDIANSMTEPEKAAEIIARSAALSSFKKVELTVAIITMLLEHDANVKMVATVFCNIKTVNILLIFRKIVILLKIHCSWPTQQK
jgi:formate dehydrogenase maturation protein FdhE